MSFSLHPGLMDPRNPQQMLPLRSGFFSASEHCSRVGTFCLPAPTAPLHLLCSTSSPLHHFLPLSLPLCLSPCAGMLHQDKAGCWHSLLLQQGRACQRDVLATLTVRAQKSSSVVSASVSWGRTVPDGLVAGTPQ